MSEATLPKLYEDLELTTVVSGVKRESKGASGHMSNNLSFDDKH